MSKLWTLVSEKKHRHCVQAMQYPDSKVHGAYMGPTWGRQAPSGLHVGTMNLAIRVMFLAYFPENWVRAAVIRGLIPMKINWNVVLEICIKCMEVWSQPTDTQGGNYVSLTLIPASGTIALNCKLTRKFCNHKLELLVLFTTMHIKHGLIFAIYCW